MDEKKKRRSDTLDKITKHIVRIEQIVENLLDNINIDEMTAYERLSLVSRFWGQHQKAIELQQTCIIDEPDKSNSILVEAFMSKMRGESSTPEAKRIIEATEGEIGQDD